MSAELEMIKNDFNLSIENIKKYIITFKKIENIDIEFTEGSEFYDRIKSLTDNIKSDLRGIKSIKYNAIIVSLYGSFELAIKKATKSVIRHMITNGVGEAQKLKRENLLSVTRALERAQADEIGKIITGLDLLYNHNDMNGYNYELSLNSFQNLKVDVVRKIAQIVGINDLLAKINKLQDVIKFIQTEQRLSDYQKAVQYIGRNPYIFNEINDLVDSRNKIAHEGFELNMWTDEMLINDIIPKLTLFVSSYIYLLQLEILNLYFKDGRRFCKIELLDSVINNNIICFNTKTHAISKKSIIYVLNAEGDAYFAKVVNIRENDTDVESSKENADIGCKLDKNVKDTYEFYLYLEEATP